MPRLLQIIRLSVMFRRLCLLQVVLTSDNLLTAGCSTGLFQVVGGKASLTEGVRLEGSNINDPDNFLNLCFITETLTSSAVLIYQDNGMTVNCVRYAIVLYSGIHFSIAF